MEKCNLNLNDENNNLFPDTNKPKAENYSYLNYNATTASSNTSNSSTESKFKDVSSKFEGIDMTGINAKLDELVVKATNPQTHDEGVKDLLNFANQMKILSDKY